MLLAPSYSDDLYIRLDPGRLLTGGLPLRQARHRPASYCNRYKKYERIAQ